MVKFQNATFPRSAHIPACMEKRHKANENKIDKGKGDRNGSNLLFIHTSCRYHDEPDEPPKCCKILRAVRFTYLLSIDFLPVRAILGFHG